MRFQEGWNLTADRSGDRLAGRCGWSGKPVGLLVVGAKGRRNGLWSMGGRENELARAGSGARLLTMGDSGEHGGSPEWRWTGHNGPPWFGAGGAGRLQALRVIDRRNGL
jgi:hypothetical protein